MRVRFLKDYPHKPTPMTTRVYPAGWVDDLPTAAAEKAIAQGKAEAVGKDGEPVKDEANDETTVDEASDEAPATTSRRRR